MKTALVEIRCPQHGATMEQRPLERQTYEQRWCGVWWDCSRRDVCHYSELFPSAELRASYAKAGRCLT